VFLCTTHEILIMQHGERGGLDASEQQKAEELPNKGEGKREEVVERSGLAYSLSESSLVNVAVVVLS